MTLLYYGLLLTSIIISLIFPIAYKRIKNKPPYSNNEALKFLGIVCAVTIVIMIILMVAFALVAIGMDIHLIDLITVITSSMIPTILGYILLMTLTFCNITKNNQDKKIFVHYIGWFVFRILELAGIVVGSTLIKWLILNITDYDWGIPIQLAIIAVCYGIYIGIKQWSTRKSVKAYSQGVKNEMEEQGIRICPECEGTIKGSDIFCPHCHHKM